ncbi:MAG: hypothetical protein PHT69_07625 [Bacteroidales bacterium]|nr:hypothetical protein [Bacteroidales bacterium]
MKILIEVLLVVFYALLFIVIIRKASFFKIEGIKSKILIGVFILKIFLGVTIALIYTYYYPDRLKADVFKYFDDGKIMYDALYQNPLDYLRMLFGIKNDSVYFDTYYTQMNNWYRVYESNIYNDSHTIIRFNALIHLFSFGYFNVHTVFMVFVAFSGQIALFRFFRQYAKIPSCLIFIASFLAPSALFWSSGVLKEGMLFFGMGFLLYFSHKIINRFTIVSFFWLVFSVLLLSYLKFYIFISLLPLLFTHFWCDKTGYKNVILKYTVTIIFFVGVSLFFHKVFPAYNLPEMMVNKQVDFYYLSLDQESGSQIALQKLEPNFFSIIRNTPKAIWNVFFIPHIFVAHNFLSVLASLENALYATMLFGLFFFFSFKREHLSLLLLCLLFVLFTYTLIGLITPVSGAIVRYKIPALPFLLMFFFLLTDFSKIEKLYGIVKSKFIRTYEKEKQLNQ